MATPVPTDQSTVLQAVVDRLNGQLSDLGFNVNTCFICLSPDPEVNVSGNLYATVAPMESKFGDEALTGGAENTCFEEAGVIVTIFTAIKLDRVEHATKMLRDSTRGLLAIKRRVLKALTGHRLSSGGNELLINLIHPLSASRPDYNAADGIGSLSISFSTDFQWDLTT